MNEIKLNKIVKSIINKSSYEHTMRHRPYLTTEEMVANGVINEGLIKTNPKDFVINYIVNHYSNELDGFYDEDGQLIMSIKKGHPAIDKIVKNMDCFGWFLSVHTDDEYQKECDVLIFEQKHQDKYTTQDIRGAYDYLFHVTPEYNKDRILKNGFTPKCKNSMFNYPDRIYFWGNRVSQEQLERMACQFWNKNHSKGKTDNYVMFVLDTSKINDVMFQMDDNCWPHAFFTTENVTNQAIIDMQILNIPKLMNYYNINTEELDSSMDFTNKNR